LETEIFTLCDFAQDNHSKLTIVGTFDGIQSRQFPTVHPTCSVAIRLRFGAKEMGEHGFRLRIIDEAGTEVINPIEGNINVGPAGDRQFGSLNIVVNFEKLKFEKAGRYSFELYIDGEWVSGLPLFLSQAV
jgi:hypothetical protein